jgi:capsid protein
MPSQRALVLRSQSPLARGGTSSAGEIRATLGSYRATDLNRARLILRDGSGDRHADDASRRLARELARDQDRSSGTYRAIVTAFLDLCIGEGVLPRPLTADPEWNKKALALFKQKAEAKAGGFDIEGVDNYFGLQRIWARAVVNDGDLLLVKLKGQTLATVEADRIDGRSGGNQYQRVVGGVRINAVTGARLAYGVAPYDGSGSFVQSEKAEFYNADEVIYVGTSSRKSQVRSLPALVANLDDSERADSLVESEIISAEQASLLWGQLEDPDGNAASGAPDPLAPTNADGTPAIGGAPTAAQGSNTVNWTDWVAGTLLHTGRRKFKQIEAQRPNLDVVEFLKALIRIFAAELGVPYELAMLDVGDLSWSGNKALLAFCERRLHVWRKQVFGPMFSSIYRWQINAWIKQGLLTAREDWWNHDHGWPRAPEADGPDQVTTDKGNLEIGRTSLHRLVGADWESVLREQGAEQRVRDGENLTRIMVAYKAIEKAKAECPGLELTWQQLLTLNGANSAPGEFLKASAAAVTASTPPAKPGDVAPTSQPSRP